ncbi:uncharacterized protein LOC143297602 [Babylonia areolata]|uniref:uncharacterized protein LOC143297602 n=1 Tax=Babylonia areolata TaxID=304850 RepID=UPI003FD2072E
MPSFTDTSNGYVQWQSARRQAKQLAQDAAIDIIEHYNHVVLNGDRDGHRHTGRYNRQVSGGLSTDQHIAEVESPRVSKKLTPRSQIKKTTTLNAENVDKKGGVFTEGISSLSKQSQFPLTLKRSDIISDNQPDNVKMAREKSRIYLTLSHPGPRTAGSKGDQSAKSVRTLPPPSSYPWADMLSVTEVGRSRSFTMDERAGLATRSTLDSRQTTSDVHPATHSKMAAKHGSQFSLLYPSMTGAPPNTPLQMPLPYKVKAPSVNIVSLDGESVTDSARKHDSRPRLPVPVRNVLGTLSGPVTSGDAKPCSKPGIDLPHLPLRYADSREASFQFTPRERPARVNHFMHSKGRRRLVIGHVKNAKVMSVITADHDKDDTEHSRTAVTDPYANRFQQTSSVTSLGDVYIPVVPQSSEGAHGNSDAEGMGVVVAEPTVMLTVEEEDETTNRNHSLVSNASLLSVPLNIKELSEARPSTEPVTEGAVDKGSDPLPPPDPRGDKASTSPEIASTSLVDTARTVATQTSLPFDPDVESRPTVVKIKTLSMFPDINGQLDGQGESSTEPLLRMTHGEGRLLGLPELKGLHAMDRHLLEDDATGPGSRRKSSGVQNMTFISPLEAWIHGPFHPCQPGDMVHFTPVSTEMVQFTLESQLWLHKCF